MEPSLEFHTFVTRWHANCLSFGVTIAIPICQERISPVLDTAARVLLVTRHRGREVERREYVLSPLPPEALARSLVELHVDVLLCAALSDVLSRALERERVRVRPHLCGEVEPVLLAFCSGKLRGDEFRMPGCLGLHQHGECGSARRSRARQARRKATGPDDQK